MPQIDKFIFIDQTFLVLFIFWVLYVIFVVCVIPKIVCDLKFSVKLVQKSLLFFVCTYQASQYCIITTLFLKNMVNFFMTFIFSFRFCSFFFVSSKGKLN